MSTRYRYDDIPLTPEEAAAERQRRLDSLDDQVQAALDDLRNLIQEKAGVAASPPPTHRRIQVSLNPGDPGYDEAPDRFSPSDYLGDMAWLNDPSIVWGADLTELLSAKPEPPPPAP